MSEKTSTEKKVHSSSSVSGQGMTLDGVVVKAAMKDTVTVLVSRYVKHPKYKKYQKKTKRYLVHNPGNTATVGDHVEIRQTRPISKNKHFIINAHLKHASDAAE